jgi:hypothetical protein
MLGPAIIAKYLTAQIFPKECSDKSRPEGCRSRISSESGLGQSQILVEKAESGLFKPQAMDILGKVLQSKPSDLKA